MRVVPPAGLFALLIAGCAVGARVGDDEPPSQGVSPTASDSGEAETGTGAEGCREDLDCTLSASLCFEPAGTCLQGGCEFTPKAAGAPCGDPTCPGSCDGLGECLGTDVCTECDPGWGDCNGDPSDGCETSLDSADHCGACDEPCLAGEHATAECIGGVCQRACESPWENCDDDWSNGCEIPTGVPSQCSTSGLDATWGCGTAWCGQSTAAKATNFGSWYCLRCVNCNVPAAGTCQWCDHFENGGTGEWFSSASCFCGSDEHNTCGP